MSVSYEYKTTHGELFKQHRCDRVICYDNCKEPDREPDDPSWPDGKGWTLLHTAASGEALYWAWRRRKVKK